MHYRSEKLAIGIAQGKRKALASCLQPNQSLKPTRILRAAYLVRYQHERGIRNVLRVQRYPLAQSGQLPADAPSHAYVLDMVVESERAP